jgi:transketolase
MHTIKPLDTDALVAAARETGGILSIEEHTVDGGLGGAIAETLLEAGAPPRTFHRVGLRAGFSSVVGSQDYLRGVYGLDEPSIMAAARRLVRAT